MAPSTPLTVPRKRIINEFRHLEERERKYGRPGSKEWKDNLHYYFNIFGMNVVTKADIDRWCLTHKWITEPVGHTDSESSSNSSETSSSSSSTYSGYPVSEHQPKTAPKLKPLRPVLPIPTPNEWSFPEREPPELLDQYGQEALLAQYGQGAARATVVPVQAPPNANPRISSRIIARKASAARARAQEPKEPEFVPNKRLRSARPEPFPPYAVIAFDRAGNSPTPPTEDPLAVRMDSGNGGAVHVADDDVNVEALYVEDDEGNVNGEAVYVEDDEGNVNGEAVYVEYDEGNVNGDVVDVVEDEGNANREAVDVANEEGNANGKAMDSDVEDEEDPFHCRQACCKERPAAVRTRIAVGITYDQDGSTEGAIQYNPLSCCGGFVMPRPTGSAATVPQEPGEPNQSRPQQRDQHSGPDEPQEPDQHYGPDAPQDAQNSGQAEPNQLATQPSAGFHTRPSFRRKNICWKHSLYRDKFMYAFENCFELAYNCGYGDGPAGLRACMKPLMGFVGGVQREFEKFLFKGEDCDVCGPARP